MDSAARGGNPRAASGNFSGVIHLGQAGQITVVGDTKVSKSFVEVAGYKAGTVKLGDAGSIADAVILESAAQGLSLIHI